MRTRLLAAPFALVLLLTSVGTAAADTVPSEQNLAIVVTSATVQVQTGVVTAYSGRFSPGPAEMGLAAQGVGHGQRIGFVTEGMNSIVLEPTH